MRHGARRSMLVGGTSEPQQTLPATLYPGTWNKYSGNAGGGSSGYAAWGWSLLQTYFYFPESAYYTITCNCDVVTASARPANSLMLFIDGIPAETGITTTGLSSQFFIHFVTAATPTPYQFTAGILKGWHSIVMRMQQAGGTSPYEFECNFVTISTPGALLPQEPSGGRDPSLFPFSSYSIWNTAIGSGAVWSLGTDADTTTLTSTTGVINASNWSTPIYIGQPSDPVGSWVCPDTNTTPVGPPFGTDYQWLHMPAGMTVAPPVSGGDHNICVFDSTNKRYAYGGFGGSVTGTNTVSVGRATVWDMYQGFMQGVTYSDYALKGLIRVSDWESGAINHMLQYALATQLLKPGDSQYSGFAWPLSESDSGSTTSYTGSVPFGSTIGIPGTVNLSTLGLTSDGLMLATALQNYGALIDVTGGEPANQLTFYAEQAASGTTWLDNMSSDLPKIIPQLRILRNQGPSSINGGGTPRVPMRPGVIAGLPAKKI